MGEGRAETLVDAEGQGVAVVEAQRVGDAEAEGERVGVPLRAGEELPLAHALPPVGLREALGVEEGEAARTLPEAVGVTRAPVPLPARVHEAQPEGDALPVVERDALGEGEGGALRVGGGEAV